MATFAQLKNNSGKTCWANDLKTRRVPAQSVQLFLPAGDRNTFSASGSL